jgi:hypothetical protein
MSLSRSISLVEREDPVRYLGKDPRPDTQAAVIYLTGRENIADFHELLTAHPRTLFVFMMDEFPPPPAMARVVHLQGSAFLRKGESALVVAATLIAMLSRAHTPA